MSDTTSDADPRDELLRLAGALEGHARRAKARGTRRVAAPRAKAAAKSVESGAAARAPLASPAHAPARSPSAPAASPAAAGRAAPAAPAPRAPAAAPTPFASSASTPRTAAPALQTAPVGGIAAGARSDRIAPGSHEERVAANRARAKTCTTLEELRAAVAGCTACELCLTRTQTVFMDGKGTKRILFVGEAPGADEDRTGVPFVGRAGQLLTDIITKGMGLARDEVWIANVVKCRPPENRDPTTAEKELCTPWFDRQVELMDPALVLPLGRHAAMHVLGLEDSMGAMRGAVHTRAGRPVVATYHPAYLLRSPGEKKECWKDIQRAMEVLGLPLPKKAGM